MTLLGHVRNGVVVLDGHPPLPDGTPVTVTVPDPPAAGDRVRLPLVRSANPGSLNLTNEQVGAVLDEEDAAPRR